ncbi:Leucine rich repeat/Leucine Rich Repeat, putative [Leishmania lindenbergi]|uniref:Leucine rich repeat/Leucine Rich Repeat n=1 Tax=Leishmania lindenbergi TaxID=651832 RepID=A0AAW2ZYP5_9TRYP
MPLWLCPNYCVWHGVVCDISGVSLNLEDMELRGFLPGVGEDVDASKVVIRGIDMGGPEMMVELSGVLPPSWSGLNHLESLDLSYTGVSGTLPPEWSELSSLEYLNLGYNMLFGTLPSNWGSLKSLRELYLNDNLLSGQIPDSWMYMDAVEVLDLTNNMLNGGLPDFIVSIKRTFGATMAKSRHPLNR